MRSDIDYARARNLLLSSGLKYGVSQLVITANQTLVEDMPTILGFDPTNTNRNITLFTPANAQSVYFQKIIHYGTGTGQLVIKDAGAVTIGTLDPGASADCYYINSSWLCFIDPGAVAAQNNASKLIIPIHMQMAELITTAIPAVAIPFNFTLTAVSFRSKNPPTTAAKAVTATAAINGVACTGGVISLTSAALTPGNTNLAGTTLTAGNTGTAGQVVSFALSAVTAFLEGSGQFELSVTRSAAP